MAPNQSAVLIGTPERSLLKAFNQHLQSIGHTHTPPIRFSDWQTHTGNTLTHTAPEQIGKMKRGCIGAHLQKRLNGPESTKTLGKGSKAALAIVFKTTQRVNEL